MVDVDKVEGPGVVVVVVVDFGVVGGFGGGGGTEIVSFYTRKEITVEKLTFFRIDFPIIGWDVI